jgi:thiol-disulfide isomerase/thioredoxin
MANGVLRFALAAILSFFVVVAGFATPVADKKPFFIVVYADWCPSCQRLKPTLALINEKYRNEIRFVRFDITSENTTAKSEEMAKNLGLGDYFKRNHDRTSVVIILDSSRKEVFRTVNEFDPECYTSVLDKFVTNQD